MKLESQVVSLGLAKRLKELGVKQVSIIRYCEFNHGEHRLYTHMLDFQGFRNEPQELPPDDIAAFTVAELGELLPNELSGMYFTSFRCARDGWWVTYSDGKDGDLAGSYWQKSEAEARALLLIHLIEKGLVRV